MSQTYYYTKKDLIKFSTPLTSSQSTPDTAFTGINKYILYRDASLQTPVGQVLYTATVYNRNTPTQTIAYNPYVLTLFFNDGKNLSSSGAHNNSTPFFPPDVVFRSTVTDRTGISRCIQYIDILALDENLRMLTLAPRKW